MKVRKGPEALCIETILILSNIMVKLADILLETVNKIFNTTHLSFIFLMHCWHLELSL